MAVKLPVNEFPANENILKTKPNYNQFYSIIYV